MGCYRKFIITQQDEIKYSPFTMFAQHLNGNLIRCHDDDGIAIENYFALLAKTIITMHTNLIKHFMWNKCGYK